MRQWFYMWLVPRSLNTFAKRYVESNTMETDALTQGTRDSDDEQEDKPRLQRNIPRPQFTDTAKEIELYVDNDMQNAELYVEDDSNISKKIFDEEAEKKELHLDKSLVELLHKYPTICNGAISEEAKRAGGGEKGNKHPETNTSRGLCVFYWLLVLSIASLIAFSIWLSVQIGLRHALMLSRRAGAKTPFTFDDIFNSSYQPRSFSVRWVDGADAFTYTNDDGDLLLYDIAANETSVLVDRDILDYYSYYWVSSDLQYVLLAYSVSSLWRHSFYAFYDTYDVQADTVSQFPTDETINRKLQYAGWSPSGHSLAFVYDNDVYYQTEPNSDTQRLTSTGVDKVFFNGVPDWLYEEEILATHYAVWWSPDSSQLVYGVFNCTSVPMFRFPYYGPKSDVYGTMIEIAYPKSGDITPGRNTLSSLHVVNLNDLAAEHQQIPPPEALQNKDHYFLRVSWRDPSSVLVVWANRVQNTSTTTVCAVADMNCVENDYRAVSNGWIDILPTVRFIENGARYLTTQPVDVASSGTWDNLALVTSPLDAGGEKTFLTQEEAEVKSISGFDSTNNLVYYISTLDDPRSRHLLRVPLDGSVEPECLTCDIANCSYVSASFSDSGQYYVLGCRGPAIPQYWLKSTSSDLEVMLEDNAEVAANLAQKDLPRVDYTTIPIGGGYNGNAKILVPPMADRDPDSQLPLIVETYGGPNSQAVDFRYSIGYETYLASSENAVYAYLDGRGTSSRGQDFKYLLYKRMATYEVEDQIIGARWFKDNLDYVDADKNAAMWGWSYGGFLTSHAVANESQEFMCGISGAALIDRRYYDTAHSERYMGLATPEENEDGYERTDVTNKVEGFRNKHFLVVHGTADDNVHFASSAQLVAALEEAEIQFRFQLYTDENHYFLGGSRHMYRLFTDFLLRECWVDGDEKAKLRRQTRVMNKNIKLHGLPEDKQRQIKND